jgi:L-asparaginase II
VTDLAATGASAGGDFVRRAAPLAEVTRGDDRRGRMFVESVHLGHLALVRLADGSDGADRADGPAGADASSGRQPAAVATGVALGAADVEVFVRSAAKPLQAAACLALLDDLPLTAEQIAVAWASHRGEARHLDAVEGLLAHAGIPASALTCPPAVAEDEPGAAPTRIQHNCSGKHALFAVTGQRLGVAREDLLDPDGELQRFVLAALGRHLDVVGVGVDGCGAPAVVARLDSLAGAYASLAAFDWGRQVRQAGLTVPGLVGGQGRLESALLGAGVVAKVGAEGVYGVGWVDDGGRPCGLAAKSLDGNPRGAAAATVTVLEELGVVPPGTWRSPPPLGGGVPVGEVRASAEVYALAERFAAR